MTKSSSISSEDIKGLKEILEIEKLSRLLEQFYSATGLANFIVDIKGNILHGVGWKSICMEFHRKHKISSERCLKSDTILANRLKEKEKYSIYICQNGMVDVATPIIIDGVHVANLFIGQFFFETPDKDFFINQAKELGFDKEKYMKALEECHVYNKETILRFLDFFSGLINMIGESALKTIKQKKQVAEITNKDKRAAELIMAKEQAEAANAVISRAWKYNRNLIEASLDPLVTIGPNGIITDVNTATENATGIHREKLIGTVFSEYFTEPGKAQAGYQQVFRDGKVFDYELELKNISGYTTPVLYNASVYKDDEGKIIGVFAAARDITTTRKFEDELIYIKNNLELLVKQRTAELIIANKELAFQSEEKEKRVAELHSVQLLLKSSLESPKDMIILSIDQNYNYYYFNKAHKDAMKYAYDKEVAIGMNSLDAIASETDRINAKYNYDLALIGKSHSTIQKYGSKAISYHETFYNPIINESNEIVGTTAFASDITDRKQAEEALKESEERFRATFEQAAVGIVHATLDGKFIRVNQKFCDIVGYTQNELLNMAFMDITHHDDLQNDMDNMTKLLNGDINTFSMEKRYFKKDCTIVWVNLTVSVINQLSGKFTYVMGIVEDISERKHAEEVVKSSEYTLRTLFEDSSDAILIIKDNEVINCNQASIELFGYDSKDNIFGKSPWELSPEKQPDGKLSKDKALEISKTTQKNGKSKFEWWYRKSDNTLITVEIMLTSILLRGQKVFHALCRDVGDRKQMEQKLEYLSNHDQLTGLYNRRFYEEELKRLDTERNLPMTIVMGDVNGLKLINDSFGHVVGDELLKKVAEVIKKGCRADDIIARLGGDEFVIVLPKTDVFNTEKIIKRIKDLSFIEKVGSIDISISFGYETKNNKEENIQEIFKKTEDHMYRHKLSESSSMRSKTIDLIMNTLFEKNNREMLHSKRVSEICEDIATKMNFDKDDVNQIRIAGLMHDIGKIGIDEKILNKHQKLNSGEWKEIERHSEIGYRILSSVNEFSEIADYILEHHEKWNGKGYPRGLKGEEISLQARIIAIADAFDAMTSNRTYSKALSEEEAINEIRRCSETQFDPNIARIFLEKVLGKGGGADIFNEN